MAGSRGRAGGRDPELPGIRPRSRRVFLPVHSMGLVHLLTVAMLFLSQSRPLSGAPVTLSPDPTLEESSDGCNRQLWGSSAMKGVQHVSTRCSEGFVAWYQPSGALRISFNSHTALPSDRLLETCFTATSHMSTMAIALETHGGKDGALKRLVTLDLDRPATQKEVCLRTSSPITLYVESSPGDLSATLGNLRIQYDVTTVNAKKVDDMEDCRPCTDDELLLAVCSMDFAVTGEMRTVKHDSLYQQTTIDVGVTKVLHQKTKYFGTSSKSKRGLSTSSSSSSSSSRSHHGNVVSPYKCGVRRGEGEFLFVGRIRLGRALLQCAPRFEEFETLWKTATKQGRNPCSFD